MAGQDRNTTIKIAVAVVALIVALGLLGWFFLGDDSAGPTPPAPTNPTPTPEQMDDLRPRPGSDDTTAGA